MNFTKKDAFIKFHQLNIKGRKEASLKLLTGIEETINYKLSQDTREKALPILESWHRRYEQQLVDYHREFNKMLKGKPESYWEPTLTIIKENILLPTEISEQSRNIEAKNDQQINEEPQPGPSHSGRKRKCYSEIGRSSQYEIAKNIAKEARDNISILLRATNSAAVSKMNYHLSQMIGKIINNLDNIENFEVLVRKEEEKSVVLEAEEAVGFLIDNNLSKQTYTNIRLESKARNANFLPPYNHVREAKKYLRPDEKDLTYSDTKAATTVQAYRRCVIILQRGSLKLMMWKLER